MFHRNITISNSTIVGVKSEGLALFNVLSSKVRNNKIYSMSGRTSTNYSNGCHCVLIGKVPAGSGAFTVKITGNQIYGGLHALVFNSQSASNYHKVPSLWKEWPGWSRRTIPSTSGNPLDISIVLCALFRSALTREPVYVKINGKYFQTTDAFTGKEYCRQSFAAGPRGQAV